LSRFVNSVNDVQVVVNNVVQYPPNYSVSGNTLTISPAPSAGTDNVYVRYLSTTLQSITVPGGSSVNGTFQVAQDTYLATSSGNVGVGTTLPTVKLQTNGAVAIQGTAGFPTSGVGIELYYDTTNGSHMQSYDRNASAWKNLVLNSNTTIFGTSGSERARITTGNFLVNTTSTFDITAGAITQLSGALAVFTAGSPNTLVSFYNGSQSARVGFIGSSGNSTQYNSGSDYRLKDNVTNISGALSKISTLRPVTFTWKISPEVGVVSGFIAHELDEVVPEAVTGEKDAMCSDGVTPDYQMVDQSKLVPLLVAAIKEQQAMIDAMKQEIAELKAKVGE
jgi:hypothetical protein